MTKKQYGSSRVFGRSSAAIVALAGLSVGLLASPTLAQDPEPTEAPASTQTPTQSLDRAEELLNRGRLIEAQHILGDFIKTDTLTDDQADMLDRLMGSLDRRLRSADPIEISLQKAEFALAQGDIAAMRRHLDAVERSRDITGSQREIAEALRTKGDSVASTVESLAGDFIEQARNDYIAGRFARAKSTLAVLTRAGVELPPEADAIRTQIFNIELERGRPFHIVEAAGLFEPGVLARLTDEGEVAAADETPLVDLFGEATFEDDQPGVIRRDDDQPDDGVPPLDAPIDLPGDDAAQPDVDDPGAGQPQPDDIIERSLRVAAQAKLAEADQAFANAEYNRALTLYNELLATSKAYFSPEQIQQIQQNASDARISLNQPGGDLIEEFGNSQEAARTELRREFDNLLQQAQQKLDSGDVAGARERASSARLVLNGGKSILAESEYETRLAQIDDMISKIETEAINIQIREAQQREQDIRLRAEQDQVKAQQQRQAKINEQLDRVRALQFEQKYSEALEVLDQTLFLDPNNPAALLMKDILRDVVITRRYQGISRNRKFEYANLTLDNYEASTPISEIITYPDDWPRLSLNRGEPVSAAEKPENRRVLTALETQRIPVDFDNPLGDVIGFLETVTGQNFDVDWASLNLLSIDEQTPVQLRLNNVPINTVLDRIVEKISDPFSPAGWAVHDGIIQIASEEVLRRNTALVIYDIRDLLIEVPDYEDAPTIDLQNVLQSAGGGGGGGGGGRSPFSGNLNNTNDNQDRDRQDRIDQIVDIIQNNVDFDGWQDNGGDTGFIQELSGALIIRNTPKNHRQISGLLSQIRAQRAMQINVETRFLLVNQDFFEEIGFDLDVYFGADNNQVQFARANDPTIRASDFFEFNPSATATDSGVGLQRSVTGAANTINGVAGGTTQGVINPTRYSPIGAAQNSLGLTEQLGGNAGNFASSILSAAPALGVAGQFLNDIQVDFLVKATQADQRSVQLTAPRLTFTNGQIANIVVATQTAFVSQLTPVVATSAVGFTPTVSVVSEGVTMEIEGTVSSDRRYVTMNVQTGVSRIDGFAEQPVTAVAGGQLVNSEDVQSFIQLPTVTVTRIQTTVTAPDQGTVLLGGQRLVTEFEIETGVPVVSKIPILSRFFTNRIESKEEQTLLILIKPTILIQAEQEERNFPGLGDTIQNSFGG